MRPTTAIGSVLPAIVVLTKQPLATLIHVRTVTLARFKQVQANLHAPTVIQEPTSLNPGSLRARTAQLGDINQAQGKLRARTAWLDNSKTA
jgi:hypothetical protein